MQTPRRSTPTAPRSLSGQGKVAAQALDDRLARGEALAARALRGRTYDDPGAAPLLTGPDDALDAWEAAWAALGALERGQLQAARATLETLLSRQRPDGLLPVRLTRRQGLVDRLAALLGRPAALRPLDQAAYATDGRTGALVNGLVAWAAGEYATRAGDPAFGARWTVALEAAIAWVEAHADPERPDVGSEAAYHQALLALGHLAIARGDAVAGARRWAAAAAAKALDQDAEREPAAPVTGALLAIYVGACDSAAAADALARAGQTLAGLTALAATRAGDLPAAQALLEAASETAQARDGFASACEAGAYLRALSELRAAAEAQAQAAKLRPKRRQLQLSEEEARILSAC